MMIGVLVAAVMAGGAVSGARVTGLRCEYATHPLAIETPQPRLSWRLESDRRGERQTAFQVLAAASEEELRKDRGSLWDSGKVDSEQSVHVLYRGKPLSSRRHVWWKVRLWDRAGNPTTWSPPAAWEMGLLRPEDWTARWIARTAAKATNATEPGDVRWIWFPEGNPRVMAPKGTRAFRLYFDMPPGKEVRQATLYAVADNAFTAFLNGRQIGKGEGWDSFYAMDVSTRLTPGRNLLAVSAYNESGPAGLAAFLHIAFSDGSFLHRTTGPDWKSSQTQPAGWQTAAFRDADWAPAAVVAKLGEEPWKMPGFSAGAQPPAYLRRVFQVTKPVAYARLYATALGLYNASLNGKPVSDEVFRPGWTDYHLRIPYQTYDVTGLLRQGANGIGLVLGDGWYAGYVGFGRKRGHYGDTPHALAQLEITYRDGSRESVVTDGSWQAGDGPLLESDLLMGETCDARLQRPAWSEPTGGASDSRAWGPVVVGTEPPVKQPPNTKPRPETPYPGGIPLVAQIGPSARRVAELHPRSIAEKPAGAYIFDLGQNMVGWARLKVKGPAGTKVTLRFAEMLNPDGSIYTTNLRGARATDHYILRGQGLETYEPSFTFHGFRYVEVTGYPGAPGKDAITGVVISSLQVDPQNFACSNPMVNQLQHNIQWGQLGNYLEVPTDCPQRDERLGWMGDAQIFVRTGCFNADIAAFMTKWMNDVEDAQSPDGGFSDVSPRLVDPSDGAPAWGDAGIIVPWTIYLCYGDTRIIAQHYEAMARWIAYIRSANPNLLWQKRGNNNFGDWLSIAADTPRDVLGTAYFAYDALLMARMAQVLGKTEDAKTYAELYEEIKAAFNRAYVSADGRIKGDTQTGYVLALRFNLLPEERRIQAAQHLAADIEKRQRHLSTGFVGVGYLTPVLTAIGRLDLAYALLSNDTFPSWGYSIKHGATTIWERWDGWTAEKGFQNPGMNSFNHYSLGSVGEWMYSTVAGIDLDPEQPGYKHILLHPRPGGGLTFARAHLDSPYGRIESDWKITEGKLTCRVRIPANTTATLALPAAKGARVQEGGRMADHAPGVQFLRSESDTILYRLGSGAYLFTVDLPAKRS